MQIAFTVCTNSHLAQAKTMADSLIKHNPNYKVVIGLVDKIQQPSHVAFALPHELIEIQTIAIPDFEDLLAKFSLYEMSCLAKPYFANYLFNTHNTLQKLLYFDTDMLIFSTLSSVEASLDDYDIIINPHVTQPFNDAATPHLRVFLNSGIYNGGFFALRRSEQAMLFLNWWQQYVNEDGYVNFCKGMFVDQLCLNFLPLFFQNVLIEQNPGYNVSYWNLHQRRIVQRDGQWWVNSDAPLIFFHFSGYQINNPEQISLHQNRHQWSERTDIQPLFKIYHQELLKNRHNEFMQIPNAYFKKPWHDKFGYLKGWVIVICRKILKELNA